MLCTIEGERFRAFRVVKHDLADAAHINRNDSLEGPYDIADDKIQARHVFDALVGLGLAEDQVDASRALTRTNSSVLWKQWTLTYRVWQFPSTK